MTATKNGINRRAFQKGLGEVKAKDLPAVTLDIEKYEGIAQVFKRYGVASPWGLV